jgi:maleate isomerase
VATTIGVILPDDGPFDYEWLRLDSWLARHAPDLAVRVERSPADGVMLKENLLAIGGEASLAPAARRLAAAGVDCVLWACTSGSFAGGYEAGQRQIEMLRDATGGRPATSTSMALAASALSLDASEVDLLSAYTGPVTDILIGFLKAAGVTVKESAALDCVNTEDSVAVDIIGEVSAFARKVGGSRPILVPDTAINTFELVGALTREAGRPVVTANHASLWHAARIAGRPEDFAASFSGLLRGG